MVKLLAGVVAALVVAAAEPLGPNDYLPPLTPNRSAEIALQDLRPDEDRTCTKTGQWWAKAGCTLRAVTYTCWDVFGMWSRDVHLWKFDGYACRYEATSEDLPQPTSAAR